MAVAFAALAGLQAIQSYSSAKVAAAGHKVQQFKYETDSKLAKMNSNNVALQLSRQFNNTMASNAVMAAAQGRSGATVEAVGRAAEAQYNWDMDFAELSRDIQTRGIDAMATSSKMAAKTSSDAALTNMLGSAGMSYLKYKMVK